MKKLAFILALVPVIIFSSCSDDTNEVSSDVVDELDLTTEAALETNYDETDDIIELGLLYIEQQGRLAEESLLGCAVVTHDEEAKIVTIDYGDGCQGPWGRLRAGKIIIEYNDRKLVPGAYRIVSFEDFSVNGVMVEGVRTVTNISESLEDHPKFSVQLVGGMLTFPDETTATREVDHVRTWIRENNPLNDEVWIEGDANGKRRDDVQYEVTIIETLVYKRSCRPGGVFIPVQGIKEVAFGDRVALIDYGNGECDNEVTITMGDESFTKTLTPRGK